MSIFDGLINCKITLIERPVPSGPGGDTTTTTVFERHVEAIRQPFNVFATAGDRLVGDLDSRLVDAENTFWMDLKKVNDVIRHVRAGDVMTWESVNVDSGGPIGTQEEILRVNIWESPNLMREHVEIFTRGQGAI